MLLIDSNNLAMREAHAKAGLSHRGRPSGVVYGFLQQVRMLTRMFPGEICFCWDSPRKTLLRRAFWSGYKANRDGQPPSEVVEDALPQMALLRNEILPRLGWPNQMYQEGYEADDLIAVLCNHPVMTHSRFPASNHVIVSSDNDLYQLLSPRTSIYLLGKRQGYTWRNFIAEYGVTPLQWVTVKAMAGDSSDGIPGLPGIGVGTAVKIVTGNSQARQPSAKVMQKLVDHKEQLNIYRRLVTLPWPGCDPGPVRRSAPDEREWRAVCNEWGLESLK